MTTYTLPPNNTKPLVLQDGDILIVNSGGKSNNVTINDGATEDVNKGGMSDHTTINGISSGDGTENVHDGTADFTTINGGFLNLLDHSVANHTRLNVIGSELHVRGGSVINDTIIQNGEVHLDSNSVANGVRFVFDPNQKFHIAKLIVDNPLDLKGTISGFHVSDQIIFPTGDVVTNFSATKDTVTFTFSEFNGPSQ
jgi:autotransporter passenger strand-loop-strand repeat protein